MRIAAVLDSFPNVTETFLLHLIVGFIQQGHEVTIFAKTSAATSETQPEVDQHRLLERMVVLRNQGFGVREILATPLSLARAPSLVAGLKCLDATSYGSGALRLRALHSLPRFAGTSFDIIHCHYAPLGWAFLPYRDVFGVPFVTSFHGAHHVSFGRSGAVRSPVRRILTADRAVPRLFKQLFAKGDAFIANSDFTLREVLSYGAPSERCHKIPALVNDEGAEFRIPDLGARPLRLLTVARLTREKGIQTAIRCLRRLREQGVAAEYRIVGDGPDRGFFEALAAREGVENAVVFLGWRSRTGVFEAMREAHVFLLPSVGKRGGGSETQGIVVQEAQLHGVPVIASAIGGLPESLDYGSAGILVEPGNVEEMTDAVRMLSERRDSTDRMVERAHRYVMGKYLRQAVVSQHLHLYNQLVA